MAWEVPKILNLKKSFINTSNLYIDWFPDRNLMLRVTNKINVFYRKKE
jgi:hypothetical protein